MKNIYLNSPLTDHTATCRWCVQQCHDRDKYEMLITCIKIQNEFSLMIGKINLMFGIWATRFVDQIIDSLERQIEFIHNHTAEVKEENPNLSEGSKEEWKLPGCSQIFNIAQSIAQTYISKFRNND